MVRATLFTLMTLSAALLISANAHAQIDPSSGLLLGPAVTPDPVATDGGVGSGVESGRYTTRRKSPPALRRKASASPTLAPAVTKVTVETSTTTGPTSEGIANPSASVDDRVQVPTTTKAGKPLPSVLVDVPETPAPNAVPKPVPSLKQIVIVRPVASPAPVVATPTLAPVERSGPIPAPIDRRWDLLDVNVAPAYLIQDAKSRFTYRNDQFVAPAVVLQTNAWLVPAFGFHASFISSLSGSLKDSLDGSQNVWATQQNLEIGARWRHQASASTLAPTLIFGADWENDQTKVASESMLRQHLRTDGLTFSGAVEIPSSPNYAWTAGISLMPLASQTERSSSVTIVSGTHADTNAIGLSVGGRYAFDHADSIYWRLTGRLQKDVYDGQAQPADPITGQTLSGVTITTKSLLLELGFSFGN